MEQFFLEHTFVSLIPYAIIAGVLFALVVGGIIVAIREVKYYLEDKKVPRYEDTVKAWHELGNDYLEVMEELGE